jgi:hypothetical protein
MAKEGNNFLVDPVQASMPQGSFLKKACYDTLTSGGVSSQDALKAFSSSTKELVYFMTLTSSAITLCLASISHHYSLATFENISAA